jgi:hypothetical protein
LCSQNRHKESKMPYCCRFMVEWRSSICSWWKSRTHGVLQLERQLLSVEKRYWGDQLWIILYLQTGLYTCMLSSILRNLRVNSKGKSSLESFVKTDLFNCHDAIIV